MKAVHQTAPTDDRSSSGTSRLIQSCAAVGVLGGFGVALKALEARSALELASNAQWFALASLASSPFRVWTLSGLVLGVGAGLLLAFLGRYEVARRRTQQAIWHLLRTSSVAIIFLTVGVTIVTHLRPTASGPNILLIVLDTTRPDRLSTYGYARPTTPYLEELAAQSVVYTNAYSTSSWTPPSHASLFTGLLPCSHGVTQESPTEIPELPASFLTLAEALWEDGYRTAGAVGNIMLQRRTGFQQGFEEYHETWQQPDEEGRHPAERFLEDLITSNSERPFFAFVNLIEPHSPYDSGREFKGVFNEDPELDIVDFRWVHHYTGTDRLSEAELRHLSDLYDSEIRYVDAVIERLIALLSERGILDETLVVLTADHGEHFGEHGLVRHQFNLYETNVRVPLIIRYPPLFPPGSRISALVQLDDVHDGILELARSDRPRTSLTLLEDDRAVDATAFYEYGFPLFQVRMIRDALFSSPEQPDLDALRTLHPEFAPLLRSLRAVRQGDFKLIAGSDGGEELYNVAADPLELTNLAHTPEYAHVLAALRRQLADAFSACVKHTAERPSSLNLDSASARQLRSLGYIR